MAFARNNPSPQFVLTPQQQNLLFRALTSNQPGAAGNNIHNPGATMGNPMPPNNSLSLSPDALTKSSAQDSKSDTLAQHGLPPTESPLLDFDYDFNPDSSFDFDFANDTQGSLIGDLPDPAPRSTSKSATPEDETSDKRSLPTGDDDEEIEEGGGKRRESEGKGPKKPGRKPLMNEPSSKRKAQNRAAQRAFRERKEKHVKDLEIKVEELEEASAKTNNENSELKTQIARLTTELSEYKKRLSLVANRSPSMDNKFGAAAIGNINDVNFQFEFPKFGALPGPPKSAGTQRPSSNYPSPLSGSNASKHNSPENHNDQASPNSTTGRMNSDTLSKETLSKLKGGFSTPSFYDTALFGDVSRTSLDSTSLNFGAGNNTGSPSSCSNSNSNSNGGPSSSCGTSPEPATQSPHGFKPLDTLTTIGEEQQSLATGNNTTFGSFGHVDYSNLDWLSQQNGGQFNPQLFGGYREPQDNVIANSAFDDTFFNDALDVDFSEPFNMPASTPGPKKSLIAEIDSRKETEDTLPSTDNGKLLTCNNIWEKLQTCPKVQNGDLDLDGLCSDLQKKAKCGGTGAVVDEFDFKTIMTKYLGAEGSEGCKG